MSSLFLLFHHLLPIRLTAKRMTPPTATILPNITAVLVLNGNYEYSVVTHYAKSASL